ncbi:hypothetical protein SAMN05880593_110102 [Rhizobium sp. RU36D]|nr:hypothetical protein SAMN05880593_110102 [Rhizobium sp. RU36D]
MRLAAISLMLVFFLGGCSRFIAPLLLEGSASNGKQSISVLGVREFNVWLTLTSSDGLICKAVVDQRDKEYRPGKVICNDGSHGLMALLWKDGVATA